MGPDSTVTRPVFHALLGEIDQLIVGKKLTSEENGQDRYEVAFEAAGYIPLSVPVLETTFVNVDILANKIAHGPDAMGISGVILTSKRAVEAWCEALRTIPVEAKRTQADWRTVMFYVVGYATARAASQIHAAFPSIPHLAPAEKFVRGGAEAGTAERLAAFILAEGVGGKRRRLLYLTGDRNRETLPEMLSGGEIALDALEVYRTTGSSTFRADLGAALAKAPVVEPWGWVVYFAPSAAAFVTPFLRDAFTDLEKLRVAAIGGTTAALLSDTLKMRVDVVAPRPTPDALCSAIVGFDKTVA